MAVLGGLGHRLTWPYLSAGNHKGRSRRSTAAAPMRAINLSPTPNDEFAGGGSFGAPRTNDTTERLGKRSAGRRPGLYFALSAAIANTGRDRNTLRRELATGNRRTGGQICSDAQRELRATCLAYQETTTAIRSSRCRAASTTTAAPRAAFRRSRHQRRDRPPADEYYIGRPSANLP